MKSALTTLSFLIVMLSSNTFSANLCTAGSPVHSDTFVIIGGIRQWVTIHGEYCQKPIILFLHGGPGQADSPISRSQYGYWEKDFVVVQWDQRGAAKTYGANEPPTELTLEDMIGDGVKLSEYLIKYLEQEKIIVTGNSWGSALGMQMVKRRPDLFHAFVGRSQTISLKLNLDAAKVNLLSVAKNNNDHDSTDMLNSLDGEWNTVDSVMKFHEVRKKYQVPLAKSDTTYEIEPIYNHPEYFQLFQKAVEFSLSQGFNADSGGLAFDIDLYKLGFDYEVPLFFIQGEKDLMTMPSTTKAFVDRLKAPIKEIILVPNLGHDSAFIEANYQVMTEKVLPLIH